MVLQRNYNPGAFQSLVMVPFGVWLIVRSFEIRFLPLCVLNGILGHVVFAAVGINLIFRFGVAAPTEILWCIVAGFVQPLLIVAATGDVLQRMLRSDIAYSAAGTASKALRGENVNAVDDSSRTSEAGWASEDC